MLAFLPPLPQVLQVRIEAGGSAGPGAPYAILPSGGPGVPAHGAPVQARLAGRGAERTTSVGHRVHVYRITEQVNQTTGRYAPLKHRKPGEYRDVPLPRRVRQAIERYADRHGTVDGNLLRHPSIPRARSRTTTSTTSGGGRIKKQDGIDLPAGMVVYSFRHFFASNCLTHNIPITDVAEWMGHKNIDVTFKISSSGVRRRVRRRLVLRRSAG
ncbi:site-specific integrase [Streptomyces sp. NPDC088812]|uniref:site-specific integrase n=1 Tax=Streptomyces sp. NPDC088812 TaxID=3365905 RepID=UPI00381A75FE